MSARVLLALMLALAAAPAWSGDRAAEIRLKSEMFEAGYLHRWTERDAVWTIRGFHRDDRGDVLSTSFHVFGDLQSAQSHGGLRAGLGGELAAVDRDGGGSGLALAVGGFLSYSLPAVPRLSLRLDALWAPEVLTVSDLDSYRRFGLEAGYDVFRGGTVFVAARNIRVEIDEVKGYLDTGMHGGFRIRF